MVEQIVIQHRRRVTVGCLEGQLQVLLLALLYSFVAAVSVVLVLKSRDIGRMLKFGLNIEHSFLLYAELLPQF